MCLKSGIGSSSRHFQSGKRFFFSCSVSIILALQPRGRFLFFLAGMGTGKCAPAETSIWSLHRISSFPRSKSIRGVPSCSKALGCFSFPAQNGHWELSQKADPECCICIVSELVKVCVQPNMLRDWFVHQCRDAGHVHCMLQDVPFAVRQFRLGVSSAQQGREGLQSCHGHSRGCTRQCILAIRMGYNDCSRCDPYPGLCMLLECQ